MRALLLGAIVASMSMGMASAQDPRTANVCGLYRDSMAPGVIGRIQLERNPRLRGCVQAIELSGPQGLKIALASDGVFVDPQPQPMRAAFLIGPVYRVQLTNIPNEEGMELFPTIEVIDRLYPPAEREHRFPIPIVFAQDDLERALRGEMVTRVIYLEDSEIAEPVSYADKIQRTYEVTGTQDAMQAADRLGRPVAIVRIGSRVPDAATGVDMQFLYGCPPWTPIKEIPDRQKLMQSQGWPEFELPRSGQPLPPANDVKAALETRKMLPPTNAARGKLGG